MKEKNLDTKTTLGLKILLSFVFAVLLFTLIPPQAESAFNKELNYQAKLTDSNGVAVADGDYNIEFKLYTTSTGGTAIWTETATSSNKITVENGLFSHRLGSINPLSGIDWNQDLYLTINVGGTSDPPNFDGEMTPRKKLTAAPASFVADTLDNLDSNQFLRSDVADEVTGSTTFNNTTTFKDDLSIEDSERVLLGTGKDASISYNGSDLIFNSQLTGSGDFLFENGSVGINTSSPDTALEVKGDVKNSGNITSTNIYPSQDNSYQLGSSNNRYANLYAVTTTIGDTITIDSDDIIGSNAFSLSSNSGNITLSPAGNAVISGLTYPSSDGTSGQALVTDGSGSLSLSDINKDVLTNSGTLGFEWSDSEISDSITADDLVTNTAVVSDSEVDDNITINSNGSVATSSLASDDFLENDGDTAAGDYNFTNGSLAINSSSPDVALEVNGGIENSGNITTTDLIASNSITLNGDRRTAWPSGSGSSAWATGTGKVYPKNTSSQVLVGSDTTSTKNSILEVSGDTYISSKLGINTTTPQKELDVKGNGRFNATTTNAYDVSTASFSKNFDTSDQDPSPYGVSFNLEGTKMFVLGDSNDNVYEYSLADNFDITTASFTRSFDVSGQDGTPLGLRFNPDGTNMFIAGNDNDNIYKYTLSTGYDLSTASFSQSFDVSGQDTTPDDVAFHSDGTQMFVIGSGNASVYEYTLGTAYDLSTASFSQSFDVSGQDTLTYGIVFNPDGTKMFITGDDNDNVYEYTLGTGYDISTASFSQSFDVSSEDPIPDGIFFNPEGTKMFISGSSNSNIYQYSVGSTEGGNLRVEGTLDSSDIAFNNLSEEQIFTMTEGDRVGENDKTLVFRNASDENRYLFNQDSAFFRAKLGIGDFGLNNKPPAEFSVRRQTTGTPLASFENSSSTAPVLHLTSDGNVAIGTNTPSAALDIQNNTSTQPVLNLNNDKGNNIFQVQNNGNVGIGTTSPDTALDINGDLKVSNTIFTDSNNNRFGINTTTPETTLEVDGTSTLAGKVAINSSSPTFASSTKLSVDGSISANISGVGTNNDLCFNSSGVIGQCNSSEVYKKNINALDLGQNTLLKLEPKTFEWKTTGEQSLGFLAQDVEKIDKRLATYDSNGDVAGVKYGEITSLLTKAIKERNKVLKTDKAPTSSPALTVNSLGEVGIGTTTPDAALDVNGKIQADNLKGGATSLSVDSQGNIIRTPSDKKLKEEIKPVSNALQKVANLQGVSYEWRNEKKFGEGREVGLLAQKVDKVVPEAVRKGGNYMSLNYDNLTALLIEAVKDQQKQIQSLAAGKSIQGISSNNFSTGTLKVSSSSEFKDIKVEEHATFGEDTVGQAVIKKGYKEVEVNFEKKYKKQPIVTAIQMGSPVEDLNYSVKDVSTAGFWITIDKRYDKDIKFNWHAFAAGEDSKIHFSDGSTSTIEVNVEEIKGCTNPKADNYDPNATEDDGSCKIGGCVDSLAVNYDPEATYGDKSCKYDNSSTSSSTSDTTSSTESVSSTETSTTTEENADSTTTTSDSTTTTTDSSNQEITSSTESSAQTSSSTTTSDETNSTSSSTDYNSETSNNDSEQTTSSSKTETTTEKTIDETAPEININGDNPVSLKVGQEYNDQGATATDNKDGDLTDKIQSKSTVDTSKAGDYTVTYRVSDSSGNKTEKDRIVKVEEKTENSSTTSTSS